MEIKYIRSLKELEERRLEILREYEDHLKKHPLSYSYPFHQMRAIRDRYRDLKNNTKP